MGQVVCELLGVAFPSSSVKSFLSKTLGPYYHWVVAGAEDSSMKSLCSRGLPGGKWDASSGLSTSGGNLFIWASLICSKNNFYLSNINIYVQWFFTFSFQFRRLYHTKTIYGIISSLSTLKKFLKLGFQLGRLEQFEITTMTRLNCYKQKQNNNNKCENLKIYLGCVVLLEINMLFMLDLLNIGNSLCISISSLLLLLSFGGARVAAWAPLIYVGKGSET